MNTLRIALWDLRRMAKDWQAALWLLVMPLLFAGIFGSAFRNNGPRDTWIPVIDLDHSELSDLFVAQLKQPGYWIDVKGPEDEPRLNNQWPYGIVVPKNFAKAILNGEAVKLTVTKGDASPENILQVQSCLTQGIVRFTKAIASLDLSHREWNDATRELLRQTLARPDLLTVATLSHRSLRPPPSGFNLSLPGILVMFVMQMVLTYGGTTLVSDRVGGQFARLSAAPVSLVDVYCGKVLARVLIGFIQSSVLLACGAILFKMQLGDHPLYLIPVFSAFAIFSGSLSLLGGALCQTEKQVIQLAIFSSLFLAALGGCWWPIEIVPALFKTVAKCTPTYWGVHAIQSVLYFNKSYEVLWLECPILLGFGAVCLLAAVPVARRRRPHAR